MHFIWFILLEIWVPIVAIKEPMWQARKASHCGSKQNRDHTPWSLLLLVRATYIQVLFFVHIPVQFHLYLLLHSFWSVTSDLWHPFPLAFAMNAALVACQWQQCAWTVPATFAEFLCFQPASPLCDVLSLIILCLWLVVDAIPAFCSAFLCDWRQSFKAMLRVLGLILSRTVSRTGQEFYVIFRAFKRFKVFFLH